MKTEEIFFIVNSSAPLITALICLGLILMRYNDKSRLADIKLLRLLIAYYLTIICAVIDSFSFVYMRSLYVYVNLFSMLSILYVIIIIYNIIYRVTSIGKTKPFSFIHYLSPIAITIVQYFWSYYFLSETNPEILYTARWFLAVSSFKLGIWIIYGTVYSLFGLKMIIRYRKAVIDYSADEDRSSLRWLSLVIILTIALIPPTFLYVFFRNEEVIVSVFSAIANLVLAFQLVILAYNLFTDNYIIMYPVGIYAGKENNASVHIIKEQFEQFIREKKPYLNPGLKITDLMLELCTNRSYLSGFINKTYGMSFSRYINNCRVIELKKMEKEVKPDNYDKEALAIKAGFRSFRGYKQFTKQESERSRG